MVEDRVIAEHLTALLTPVITSQSTFFRELGLRDRFLTLALMVAAVVTLLWRNRNKLRKNSFSQLLHIVFIFSR